MKRSGDLFKPAMYHIGEQVFVCVPTLVEKLSLTYTIPCLNTLRIITFKIRLPLLAILRV